MLLVLTGWLSREQVLRYEVPVYDRLIAWQPIKPDPRLLIIEIDEYSLAELGRWPWPRQYHAELLERLTVAGVDSVLFDVLFLEPSSSPASDQALAAAMAEHGRVFLPVRALLGPGEEGRLRLLLPVGILAEAARGLGHIRGHLDRDGILRRIDLQQWDDTQSWPQLTWALYESLSRRGLVDGQALTRDAAGFVKPAPQRVLIPYAGSPGHFPRVSYASVLKGEVPPSLLRDRIALIGTTAAGLGDWQPTPVGGMPGVEVHANLLNAWLSGHAITEVGGVAMVGGSLLAVAGFVLLLPMLRWGYAPMAVVAYSLLLLVATYAALRLGWWWSPSASIAMVILAYLLWEWRSRASLLGWFSSELRALEQESWLLPKLPLSPAPPYLGSIHHQASKLKAAIDYLSQSRSFLKNVLDSLPVATFILAGDGRLLMANRLAERHVGGGRTLQGASIGELVSQLSGYPQEEGVDHREAAYWVGREFTDSQGRHFRLEAAPLWSGLPSMEAAWLVALIDMTDERRSAEQRAHMLRFLSHDLKAPQSSILALIGLQRDGKSALPEGELCNRIERQVRYGLALTDDFLQLTKVEFSPLECRPLLLGDVAMEAMDRAWPVAVSRQVVLDSQLPEDGCPMQGDPSLLVRAIHNLLDNAIKYSPEGARVSLAIWREEAEVLCRIRDEGQGIAVKHLPHIFESYRRFDHGGVAKGFGLGLALVKTVVERHGGEVSCESQEGQGSAFTLRFPDGDEQRG
ncbi:CHASE2 domain-containing protein [Halomonas salifodinae]|uniref:CHASE2 domain-containing protein n=1 Tax=Halomonas salifodinae TaxID=438745 RepID=UPI0033AC38E0